MSEKEAAKNLPSRGGCRPNNHKEALGWDPEDRGRPCGLDGQYRRRRARGEAVRASPARGRRECFAELKLHQPHKRKPLKAFSRGLRQS